MTKSCGALGALDTCVQPSHSQKPSPLALTLKQLVGQPILAAAAFQAALFARGRLGFPRKRRSLGDRSPLV
jgi:hypothetical protein